MERSTNAVNIFHVVKFVESPNVDIEGYVCVPDSWVLSELSECPERRPRVQVAYPSGEARETTSERVKREEAPWDEWNLYSADVICTIDSYDSARAWIRFKGSNLLTALDCGDTANTEVMDSTSSGPSGCSNQSSPSSSDERNLRMEEPSVNTNPSIADQKLPLLESSKRGPYYTVFWKKLIQERVLKSMPLTAKSPSISTQQSRLPAPLPNGKMDDRNKENVPIEIQGDVIQDGIPNNKKDEVIDQNKTPQKIKNKKRRSSVANAAFIYYVVQFKDLPDPTMRINNYVCVRNTWITSGLADSDNVFGNINREVKVAYPVDPGEIPSDFRKSSEDPPKEWKSYRAVIKHITGSFCAAGYWMEQEMGRGLAPVKNDATDMGRVRGAVGGAVQGAGGAAAAAAGYYPVRQHRRRHSSPARRQLHDDCGTLPGNPPIAAEDNSSGSSGGSSSNIPSNNLSESEEALIHLILQPGITVKKIRKRPAISAIVDSQKRPRRVEESTAVHKILSIADRKSNKPIQTKQNQSSLGSKLIQAYDSVTQRIMSAQRTNSQQIPPQSQAYMNQRDLSHSVDSKRFAAQNMYSTHGIPGHPHMWPKGRNHIPAYQGYTYQNAQSNPVNNRGYTNHTAYLQSGINGHNPAYPAYNCSGIPQYAPDNPHLFDPREHSQHRPFTNNYPTSCCFICDGNPSKMSDDIHDLVIRLIALLKEQDNQRRPPEHSYETAY